MFTPFFKLRQKELAKKEITIHHAPHAIQSPHISIPDKEKVFAALSYEKNSTWDISGAKARIRDFDFARYDETRNFPAIDGSSKLSPYIRFGLVSIRELYTKALTENAQVYISELARREFRHHIMFYFPETRLTEFLEKRRKLAWDNNEKYFTARKE